MTRLSLLACLLFISLPVFSANAGKNTVQYTVPEVRTFSQKGNCLCAAYTTIHALQVRFLQREGETVFFDPRSVQWSQIYDRYWEQIQGFRTNAVLDECFTEAPYPHDVVRQIAQYGINAVEASEIESIQGFSHEKAMELLDLVSMDKNEAAQEKALELNLPKYLGNFPGDLHTAQMLLKNDQWVGFVPEEFTFQSGLIDFIPPAMFQNELPMPLMMPLVKSLPRAEIMQKIIDSVKAGVPVPYCADTHCRSIDGLELDQAGNIVKFYYADSYGPSDFSWSDSQDAKSAHNAFVYVIMQ